MQVDPALDDVSAPIRHTSLHRGAPSAPAAPRAGTSVSLAIYPPASAAMAPCHVSRPTMSQELPWHKAHGANSRTGLAGGPSKQAEAQAGGAESFAFPEADSVYSVDPAPSLPSVDTEDLRHADMMERLEALGKVRPCTVCKGHAQTGALQCSGASLQLRLLS